MGKLKSIHDTMLVAKDNKIVAPKAQLAEKKWQRTPSSDADTVSVVERQKTVGVGMVTYHL